MPGGRPPIWTDPQAFKEAVDSYFDNKEEVHTWTGLTLHLGFESRQSLNDYLEKEEFFHPIKMALLKIENSYEKRMFTAKNPTGAIFALKNFGWKDKQEIDQKTEHSGGISIKFEEPDLHNTEDQSSS